MKCASELQVIEVEWMKVKKIANFWYYTRIDGLKTLANGSFCILCS